MRTKKFTLYSYAKEQRLNIELYITSNRNFLKFSIRKLDFVKT